VPTPGTRNSTATDANPGNADPGCIVAPSAALELLATVAGRERVHRRLLAAPLA
jgi:hypothetical protein